MPAKQNTVAKVGKGVVSYAEKGEPTQLAEDCAASSHPPPYRARGPPSDILEQLLTVGEVAAILRCSKSSLDKWRLRGGGPAFVYVGRRVRYTRAALAAFIGNCTRVSTSDPGGQAATTA
jgi:hypothetical protein